MPDVIVVGGGPAGLSAAPFTAKNGLDTVVFDDDDGTWMHKAHLFNYLGIGSRDGTAFVETARTRVDGFGVERRQGEAVTDVAATDGGFVVTTDDGDHEADYLVLATGADRSLADALGCAFDVDVVLKITFEYLRSVRAVCSKTHFHGEPIEDVTDYRTKRLDGGDCDWIVSP
jgi:thioredoxin reductase